MDNNANTQNITEEDVLNNLTDEETMDVFIWGIMDEKGIKDGGPDILQGVHDELKQQLLEQIDRSLIAELPEEKLEEFNKIAEEQGKIDPDVLAQAIADAGIDIQAVTAVTMDRFRDIYLNGASDEDEPLEQEQE